MEEQYQQQKKLKISALMTSTTSQKLCSNEQGFIVARDADGSAEDDYFKSMPPGFRFCPLDEELITHYLRKKVQKRRLPPNRIKEVHLMNYNPEDLIKEYMKYGEREWYFFTPRDRKHPNGTRPNRIAGDGFWKAIAGDKDVTNSNGIKIGSKKSLVFYKGKLPRANKTDWLMQEYRLVEEENPPTSNSANAMRLDDCVLCKVYKKPNKRPQKPEDDESVPPTRVFDEDTALINVQPDQFAEPINGCNGSMGGDTVGLCNGRMVGELINYSFESQSQEINHGLTCNLSSMTPAMNHGVLVDPISSELPQISYSQPSMQNQPLGNPYNHPSFLLMDDQMLVSSMPSSMQFMDTQLPISSSQPSMLFMQKQQNQPSCSQPSFMQFMDDLQLPQWLKDPEQGGLNLSEFGLEHFNGIESHLLPTGEFYSDTNPVLLSPTPDDQVPPPPPPPPPHLLNCHHHHNHHSKVATID